MWAACLKRSACRPRTRRSFSSTACAFQPTNCWGVEGQGFGQLGALPYERMVIAVPAAAVIDRALELTIEYTKQRKIFGAPLFDMQTTRQKLAEMATIAHVVRSFVNDCTQRLLDGTLDNEAAYMAGGAPNSSAAWWTSVSTVRRLRLHGRVPDRADVCRFASAEDLRRCQRGPERPGFEEAVNMPHTSHTLQLPLHGVRVVEFEGIGPGPLAARMLVDMGAEVIALARAEQAAGRSGWAGRWRTRCTAVRRWRSST